MNPNDVAKARIARLAREAAKPVYTTVTPAREHLVAVEIDGVWGRHWSHMVESDLDQYLSTLSGDVELSDIDHSGKCWCFNRPTADLTKTADEYMANLVAAGHR